MSSVIDSMLAVLRDRIENVRTGNGYDFNVGEVARPTRDGDYSKEHYSVIIYHGDPESNEELSHAGNPPSVAFDIPIYMTCHIRQQPSDDTPLDSLKSEVWENIARSVTSPDNWHQLGGYAINSMLMPMRYEGDSDETHGVTVELLTTYRVSEINPGVLAG